jgi:hypothetical protein
MEVFRKILSFENFAISGSISSLMATALSENIKVLIRPAQWAKHLLEDGLTDGFECKVLHNANGFLFSDTNLR